MSPPAPPACQPCQLPLSLGIPFSPHPVEQILLGNALNAAGTRGQAVGVEFSHDPADPGIYRESVHTAESIEQDALGHFFSDPGHFAQLGFGVRKRKGIAGRKADLAGGDFLRRINQVFGTISGSNRGEVFYGASGKRLRRRNRIAARGQLGAEQPAEAVDDAADARDIVVGGEDEREQRLPWVLPQDADAGTGSDGLPQRRIFREAGEDGGVIGCQVKIGDPEAGKPSAVRIKEKEFLRPELLQAGAGILDHRGPDAEFRLIPAKGLAAEEGVSRIQVRQPDEPDPIVLFPDFQCDPPPLDEIKMKNEFSE